MVKKILFVLFILFGILFLGYLIMPEPDFPEPPDGFVQSKEPADTETPFRRGYFTDLSREEVVNHYRGEFGWGYRLNYPPEEAQTIIRDQTKSTFLEEFVHPFRESLFVNGYEPKENENAVGIGGKVYKQKIIVKYVPSTYFARIPLGVLSLGLIWLIYRLL